MASSKRIPLKTVEETIAGTDGTESTMVLGYAAVILDALRGGGVRGMTVGEMSSRIKVLDKVEAAVNDEATEVLLTPEEHQTLVGVLKDFRFRMVLRSAVDLLSDVEYAPDAEAEAEAKAD